MSNPWFRFYSEAVKDRKVKYVAERTGQSKATILGVLAVIFSMANDSPQPGKLLLANKIAIKTEEIAEDCGIKLKKIETILAELVAVGIIELTENNPHGEPYYYCVNWDKRQFKHDNSTVRVRRHRQKMAQKAADNVTVTETVTANRYCNLPDTDTDTDIKESTKKEATPLVEELGKLPKTTPGQQIIADWIDLNIQIRGKAPLKLTGADGKQGKILAGQVSREEYLETMRYFLKRYQNPGTRKYPYTTISLASFASAAVYQRARDDMEGEPGEARPLLKAIGEA